MATQLIRLGTSNHPVMLSNHIIFELSHAFIFTTTLFEFLAISFLSSSLAHDRPTLYADGDNVLELFTSDFNESVYNKPSAFFIEFYSSWCGHCIEYKPHFVRLATMMKSWKNVVTVAVINCADELNSPICREHAIDAFPTLKYFHSNAKNHEDNIRFKGDYHNLQTVSEQIAQWAKEDFDRISPTSWPQLTHTPSEVSLSELWTKAEAKANKDIELLCVIAEDQPAKHAYALMINYAEDPRIGVFLVDPSHKLVQDTDVKNPGLVIYKRDQKEGPIYKSGAPMGSWEDMQKKVDEFLSNIARPLESGLKKVDPAKAIPTVTESNEVNWTQFEVQYLDLTSAYHYMLTQEIPRNPVIAGAELVALRSWIHLLRLFGPGSAPIRRFFFRLDEWLRGAMAKESLISTDKYLAKFEEIQSELGRPIPANVKYMACRGSLPNLRGYTCSLWTLLHAISAQAYKERKDDPHFSPVEEVLDPIHQFVTQFLSCEVCSQNFDKMFKEDIHLAQNTDDVVLWLWRAHNKVNKRLHGQPSEDPHFPKQQFPPNSLCSECRDTETDFNEQETLRFMLKYYSNIKADNLLPEPRYKLNEYDKGKLEIVANRRLNPKFEGMAGKVENSEQFAARLREEQQEIGGLKHHWKQIEGDALDSIPLDVNQSTTSFYLFWLFIAGSVFMMAYWKYRRNRSSCFRLGKFWKTFYYSNNYKV